MTNRRILCIALALCAAVALAPSARAGNPSLSAQAYRPSPFPGALFGAHAARVPAHVSFGGGVSLTYARSPLAFRAEEGEISLRQDVVRDQLAAELSLWTSFYDRFGVGLTLPVFLAQLGERSPLVSVSSYSAFSIGDLRLSPKFLLFWNEERRVGLGVELGLELPTAQSGNFSGEASAVFSPRLALEWEPTPVRLLFNLGYRLREDVRLASLRVRDQILFDLALAVTLGRTGLSLVAETEVAFSAVDPAAASETQAELRFGLNYDADSGLYARFGVGPGLSSGWGTPRARAIVQIGYAARVFVGDRDGDHIVGEADACPNDPEDYDGFRDRDGCPDPDNDGDGIADIRDRCPLSREDPDGFEDDDGCPELDEAGESRVIAETPPPAPALESERERVSRFGEQLLLDEKIHFREDGVTLDEASLPVLRALAHFLLAHPEFDRVRIEAHSDATGDRLENRRRTVRQAAAVADALIREGVSPVRLESAGFGETRPIAPNTDEEGREENRRVEFWIGGE